MNMIPAAAALCVTLCVTTVSAEAAAAREFFVSRPVSGRDKSIWRSEPGLRGLEESHGFDTKGQYATELPARPEVFVRPNRYEPGRAHIVVYNWDVRPEVRADLSTSGLKAGQQYQIQDAQNFAGEPVTSGIYGGREVRIPMRGLVHARPVGEVKFAPVHTAPAFAVFVLLPEVR